MKREDAEIRQAIEERLRQTPGVFFSSVSMGEDGRLEGVQVLVQDSRTAKEWREELTSIIEGVIGEPIPPEFLTLTIWDSHDLTAHLNRPRVEKILFQTSLEQAEVKICLSWKGDVYWGEAAGPNTAFFVRLLIAQATLKALNGFIKPGFSLSLIGAQEVMMNERTLVVTCVALSSSYGEQTLTGSSFVRNNHVEAVVKSTLASLNRIWSRISI